MAETPIGSQIYKDCEVDTDANAVFNAAITFYNLQLLDPNIRQGVGFRLESKSSSRKFSDKLNITALGSSSMGVVRIFTESNFPDSEKVNSYRKFDRSSLSAPQHGICVR